MDPRIITALRAASRVVVLTGAGVSAESGIPTFRDKLSVLWERFDAAELATPYGFERDPALVWGWYESRRAAILNAQPNPAHRALAAMQTLVPAPRPSKPTPIPPI
jgi:NAD-dependent deacetylase